MSEGRPVVEAAGVGKAYGRTWALRGVDLVVGADERVVLLGHNGAGKTTLMRLLATLARPSRGSLRLFGADPARHAQAVRRRLGVITHKPLLYEDLTGRENLEFYARLYGVADAPARYGPLLDGVGLARAADKPVRAYSRGMQQRLSLVRALLHEPALLLLDEPDTGLDQDALRFLEAAIRGEGAQRATVFTTHNLELGLRLADRVVMLAGGRVVYDAPSGALEPAPFQETYRELAGIRT
jgi:ABC-type multidrug transport system ATPase subunit